MSKNVTDIPVDMIKRTYKYLRMITKATWNHEAFSSTALSTSFRLGR